MHKSLLASCLLSTTLMAPAAFSFEAGDIIVRAGAIAVETHEKSSDIKGDRGIIAGANLGGKAALNNDVQLGLNITYMFNQHIGLELLAASPFKHDVKVQGTTPNIDGKLGSLKHLPPTLSVVYYPMFDKQSIFQPYIGAGINYTWFFDERASTSAKAGDNAAGVPLTKFKAENTWGWAVQVGADLMLTENIMLNAQVRYIDIDTTATVEVAGGAGRAKVDIDVKPLVYMLGVGYKF